jgi:(1->4)-alpha-D-glucan 1-alpha-D-glucosylmutase
MTSACEWLRMATPHLPVATYRLQFNRNFRFADAVELIPYLQRLGITELYASPLLAARKGSLHGYDVIDPTRLNDELGTPEDFARLCQELKSRGMGLLLDIVPNHMSMSNENRWWMDVLENGRKSPYAFFFDINWDHPRPALSNKVLLPILGRPYGSVLESGELRLTIEEDGFVVIYFENRLPISPKSYSRILRLRLDSLPAEDGPLGRARKELQGLIKEIDRYQSDSVNEDQLSSGHNVLKAEPAAHSDLGRASASALDLPSIFHDTPGGQPESSLDTQKAAPSIDSHSVKAHLWQLYRTMPAIRSHIDANLNAFNGRKGDPASFKSLDQLLDEQAYWLSFWRLADEEINYRRFFTISDLICMRVEDPAVFKATHEFILKLVRTGSITGLRIDHIDGLCDPVGYLKRLTRKAIEPAESDVGDRSASHPYVVVEKILAADEMLPRDWPVCGTTGYDSLNEINRLFVDVAGLEELGQTYAKVTGSKAAFKDVAYAGKHLVIRTLFGGEMRSLGHQLGRLAEQDRYVRDLPVRELERALVEVTACFPVYRSYIRSAELSARDRRYIERAIAEAEVRNASVSAQVFDFVRSVLLLENPSYLEDEQRDARLRFVMRWQQFTGPIMAKGVEDTALYVYNRLVSLNEVGSEADLPSEPVETFHSRMRLRHSRWAWTMNASSTHDTKRGEDVRARLNVLSEIPDRWEMKVDLWSSLNGVYVDTLEGRPVPDHNEEYFLYQTLVGAWPVHKRDEPDFRRRVEAYAIKAAREAKVHTRWTRPEVKREQRLVSFIRRILDPSLQNGFLQDFLLFQNEIALYGVLNSLGQTLLKIAIPGIPDFYQGTELWGLSLVDPDNRRPVDFRERAELLKQIDLLERQGAVPVADLLHCWQDGRIKLFVIARSLHLRRSNRALFLKGDYLPLTATAGAARHICAFARRHRTKWVLVAVPRLITKLAKPGDLPLGSAVWRESALQLPNEAPEHWTNIFTGETLHIKDSEGTSTIAVADVFRTCPVALLAGGNTEAQFLPERFVR